VVHSGAASALLDPVDEHESESEGWLITYLDMITLLLVMMVVMLAFAGGLHGLGRSPLEPVSTPAAVAPVQLPPLPLDTPATASPPALPLPDLGEDIEVLVNDRSVSFRISSEILFDSGQADLSLGGLVLLRRLVPVLRDSPHPVAVHGHTDPLPIRSARFPSNWELSSARAGSVVRYLEANGIDKQRLRAVGLADTRPLADNASAEGRAQNRRVELVMQQPGI
jgi:chemotaxis protein MotB